MFACYADVVPPRYAYWTILIDNTPTAFRAKDKDELLPTFNQLRRTNRDVVFKWFARGRLWDTPGQAEWAAKHLKPVQERRGRDWRPGGQHRDPRQRRPRPSSPSAPGADRRLTGPLDRPAGWKQSAPTTGSKQGLEKPALPRKDKKWARPWDAKRPNAGDRQRSGGPRSPTARAAPQQKEQRNRDLPATRKKVEPGDD